MESRVKLIQALRPYLVRYRRPYLLGSLFLIIGAVFMLFLAGIIEGVFRQTVLSIPIRYAVAISSAVVWFLYFGVLGRAGEDSA